MGLMAGKYAIVTGGGTGIGKGIARRFIEQGAASVMIIGRREDVLEAAKTELSAIVSDTQIKSMVCDVTNEEQVKAAVAAACNEQGELDVMVANAGTAFPSPILEADLDGWRFTYELNVMGTLICTKQAAQKMKNNGGSIINISTVEAAGPAKWMASYSSSKAAMEMMTQCAARELAEFNIRVNVIRPGYIPTEVQQGVMTEEWIKDAVSETDLGRPGTPEEIGDAALYFASDLGKWTTGQILGVCGGLGNPKGLDFSCMVDLVHGPELLQRVTNK